MLERPQELLIARGACASSPALPLTTRAATALGLRGLSKGVFRKNTLYANASQKLFDGPRECLARATDDQYDQSIVSLKVKALALVVLLAFTPLLGGCASHLSRGTDLYSDGRYVEAAEVFARTEYRLPDSSAAQKASYGLYRGLTLMRLGDLNGAQRWLSYTYKIERRQPGTLPAERRALLDNGWYELGQRVRFAAQRPSPQDEVVAAKNPTVSSPAPAAVSPAETPHKHSLAP